MNARFAMFWGVAILLTGALGCKPKALPASETSASARQLRQLSGDEILRFVNNNVVADAGWAKRGVKPPIGEQFCPGGYWALAGGEVVVVGTYRIESDRLCVFKDAAPERGECRFMFRDRDGNVLQQEEGSKSAPVAIRSYGKLRCP